MPVSIRASEVYITQIKCRAYTNFVIIRSAQAVRDQDSGFTNVKTQVPATVTMHVC